MTLAGCPLCFGSPVPSIIRGGHSGKYFLVSATCPHIWQVVNYQKAATTEEEAAERWSQWAKSQPTQQTQPASDTPSTPPTPETPKP